MNCDHYDQWMNYDYDVRLLLINCWWVYFRSLSHLHSLLQVWLTLLVQVWKWMFWFCFWTSWCCYLFQSLYWLHLWAKNHSMSIFCSLVEAKINNSTKHSKIRTNSAYLQCTNERNMTVYRKENIVYGEQNTCTVKHEQQWRQKSLFLFSLGKLLSTGTDEIKTGLLRYTTH